MCRAWAAALHVSFQGHMYSVGIAISACGVVLHDGVGTCLVMVLELNTLTFVPYMFSRITCPTSVVFSNRQQARLRCPRRDGGTSKASLILEAIPFSSLSGQIKRNV
jgi:hypothetical protein